MTLNGIIALILLYFTEFDSFACLLRVTVVEDRPVLSAEYRLSLSAKTDPPCSAVSLRAELPVTKRCQISYTRISALRPIMTDVRVLTKKLTKRCQNRKELKNDLVPRKQ